jgi:hypothetical protein
MSPEKTTDTFVIVWVALFFFLLMVAAVYQVVALLDRKKNNAISHSVARFTARWPWLRVAFVVFLGLFFVFFVTWGAVAASDLAGYELNVGSILQSVGNVTTKTLSGLINGAPVSLRVRSKDTSGNVSAWSNQVVGTPHAATPEGTLENVATIEITFNGKDIYTGTVQGLVVVNQNGTVRTPKLPIKFTSRSLTIGNTTYARPPLRPGEIAAPNLPANSRTTPFQIRLRFKSQ